MAKSTATPEPKTDALAPETRKPAIPANAKFAGITTAALLLGGAAWAITSSSASDDEEKKPDDGSVSTATTPGSSTTTESLNANTDISVMVGKLHIADAPIAHSITDAMSFADAFKAARHEIGAGGVFGWHHTIYNTFTKDEWVDLSLTQRQEFLKSVGYEAMPHHQTQQAYQATKDHTPTAPAATIEGEIAGRRAIGIDSDGDGILDSVVIEGVDGHTYKLLDTSGNQGFDTFYEFDLMKQEMTLIRPLDAPFILTTADFQQSIESSMMNEVMDSVLADELRMHDDTESEDDITDPDEGEGEGEGYVNNAEMDEYHN